MLLGVFFVLGWWASTVISITATLPATAIPAPLSFVSTARIAVARKSGRTSTTSRRYAATSSIATPSGVLNADILKTLDRNGHVVIPNFLTPSLVEELRQDVIHLRSNGQFQVAKIGQDSTNQLNQDIRVAETCFLGQNKLSEWPCPSRDSALYDALAQVRQELATHSGINLDASLDELLYAYYPKGGFYKRHVDAVANSASVLRTYSLLLYLNPSDWQDDWGGKLRIHLDSGRDFLPPGEAPNYVDVVPQGGTLVLLESSKVPHEVLDTQAERMVVVGWYNRAVTAGDIANLGEGNGAVRIAMLAVAAALVTVGLVDLLGNL